MMSRANKILALLLVAQLALIAYVYRPDRTTGPPAVHFFKDVAAAQVVGLAIADSNQVLAIKKENGTWRISTEPSYPAEAKKVEALIKKLLTLTSSRLVARTEASHGRLKVATDDYHRKLTLTMADGKTREMLLGTSPNYKTSHVRVAGDDNVYLAKDLADWEASVAPEDWWENNYLDVNPADLKSLTLVNGKGRIELSRDKENKWQAAGMPEGKTFADAALNNFLNKACLVQLSSYLGRDHTDVEFGLDKPLADLVLVTVTGATLQLKVAAGDAKMEECIAKAGESPFYVTVHASEVKSLMETTLESLLVGKAVVSEKQQK